MDDDDLYGDLEGDEVDLYGGLVDDTATKNPKPIDKDPNSQPQSPAATIPPPQPDQTPAQTTLAPAQLNFAAGKHTDSGKIFVGGLNWDTTEVKLQSYFSKYGEIIDSVIMRDNLTGRSRGFGFITFADAKIVDGVLTLQHTIDGKVVDPKRAVPRGDQEKTEKIFVGGIAPEVSEDEFKEYFSQFGGVIDATLMNDRDSGRPRGFGFITFEQSECVDRVLNRQGSLQLRDKLVEVKRAQPKGAPALAKNSNYPATRPPSMMPQQNAAAAYLPQMYGGQPSQAYSMYPGMEGAVQTPIDPQYAYYNPARPVAMGYPMMPAFQGYGAGYARGGFAARGYYRPPPQQQQQQMGRGGYYFQDPGHLQHLQQQSYNGGDAAGNQYTPSSSSSRGENRDPRKRHHPYSRN